MSGNMTIGISKERLLRKLVYMPVGISDYDRGRNAVLNELLIECTELNPWQLIDENTPKDRLIWGFVDGHKRLIIWAKTSHVPLYGFCLADQGAEDFDICHPTHWMELPENPK